MRSDVTTHGKTRAIPRVAQHVKAEHRPFTWLLDSMIDQAGFAIVDRPVNRGVYAAHTCIRNPSAQ